MDDDTKRKNRERLERAITPIGSGGGSRTYSRTPSTAKLPDWDFWRNMPEVEWHEACALALNIDPDSVIRNDDGMGMLGYDGTDTFRGFSSDEAANRFTKLLRLLNGNLNNREHFTATYQNTVYLTEFAAWCVQLGWDIPQELAALAKDVSQAAPVADVKPGTENTLSALFDPVTVESLEKMFPAVGKWKSWADKAKANGLIDAREGRGLFNPYNAAMWFLKKGVSGWDLARCNRVLANNLPARSRGDEHLLTGGID